MKALMVYFTLLRPRAVLDQLKEEAMPECEVSAFRAYLLLCINTSVEQTGVRYRYLRTMFISMKFEIFWKRYLFNVSLLIANLITIDW